MLKDLYGGRGVLRGDVENEVGTILFKLERAQRDRTGAYLTAAELELVAQVGVLRLLAYASADEMLRQLEREAQGAD